jgi:hypothetical protein
VEYSKKTNVALWTMQSLIGLFFIVASGAPKLLLPFESLPLPIPLPQLFVQFIGVGEVLGGIGLILPGLVRIRTGLTPLAALGLVIVTVSATVYQLAAQQPANAAFALVMALLVGSVGYARWRVAPLRNSTRAARLVATV